MGSKLKKRLYKLKKNKGISLVEVLLALAVSIVLISMIAIVISFSSKTLKYSRNLINENSMSYDSSAILCKYVRESKLITLDKQNEKVIIQVPETLVGGTNATINHAVYLYVDKNLKQLCLDTDSTELGTVILAKDITRVKFNIKTNGLGYIVEDKEGIQYYGFAYKRIT